MTTEPQPASYAQTIDNLAVEVELDGNDVETVLTESPTNAAYIHSLVTIYGVTAQQATNDLIEAVDRIAAEPDPNADYNDMLIAQEQEEFARSGN